MELTFNSCLRHFANSMLYKIESSLSRKLGFFTYKKALDLPALAFEKQSSGEIINRITNDTESLSNAFGRLLNVISSLIASLIIIVYVFINSYIIGIEIILLVGLLFLVMNKYNPKLKNVHTERKAEQDKFTSLVSESITGIREIKSLGIKKNIENGVFSILDKLFMHTKEIKKYNEFTWMIEDLLSEVSLTRFFLLAGDDRALMIDAGMNTKNAKEIGEGILKEAGVYDKLISEEKPMLIAITHGHGDHMGGLGAFSDLYMSLTDYQQFDVETNYPGIVFHPVKEGDKIDLGGRVLEVFENPGHSPGSLAFLDIQNRFLITDQMLSFSGFGLICSILSSLCVAILSPLTSNKLSSILKSKVSGTSFSYISNLISATINCFASF